MADKIYSAKEAAIAVLAKAEELYKSSSLAKAETGYEKGVHVQGANGMLGKIPGRSTVGEQTRRASLMTDQANHPRARANETEYGREESSKATDKAKTGHKQVLAEMKAMPKPDLGKAEELYRSSTLAKDKELEKSISTGSGRPSAESGHEKGINTRANPHNPISISEAGRESRSAGKWAADKKAGIGSKKVTGELAREHKGAAVAAHKQVLGEMKAMPKPDLGKAEEVPASAPAGALADNSSEAGMKGHIKLAKFIGRMEHKKGQKAKEMDKAEGQMAAPPPAEPAPTASPAPRTINQQIGNPFGKGM